MASGKSTLGKILVQRLGLDYLDTDTLIEKQMPIHQIFDKLGEKVFRGEEEKVLKRFCMDHKKRCSNIHRRRSVLLWRKPLPDEAERIGDIYSGTSR